jgi:hypothetical protein
VIPVIRKNVQSNPNGLCINCTSSGEKDEERVSVELYARRVTLAGIIAAAAGQ